MHRVDTIYRFEIGQETFRKKFPPFSLPGRDLWLHRIVIAFNVVVTSLIIQHVDDTTKFHNASYVKHIHSGCRLGVDGCKKRTGILFIHSRTTMYNLVRDFR